MTIYFYKADDSYGCFSNFSLHEIHIQNLDWPTVEHYYQAQKLVGTREHYLIETIRACPTPKDAAKIGRDRSRTIRDDWENVKIPIMREAVLIKFLTHLDIQQVLLETGDRELVEDSPVDYYWGCGKDKTGLNHLGKILMSVRQQIIERDKN
jgi:N-glycosidase YbiA